MADYFVCAIIPPLFLPSDPCFTVSEIDRSYAYKEEADSAYCLLDFSILVAFDWLAMHLAMQQ